MEVIKPFFTFYNMFDRMKSNDEQSPHILSRLEALQDLVVFVQKRNPDQLSEDLNKALDKLTDILVSAKTVLSKFSKINMMAHMVKAGDYKAEFENLNKSLTDAFVTLSGALHVHQERKLDEQDNKLAKQTEKLLEQETKLDKQQKKLEEQEEKLAEKTEKMLEQEMKLDRQQKKLEEQEDRLTEQEDLLQRVESKLMYETRAYYCVLQ